MGRGAGKGGREAAPWMTADNKKRLGFTSAERPVSFSLEVMTSHLRKKKKPFLQFFHDSFGQNVGTRQSVSQEIAHAAHAC